MPLTERNINTKNKRISSNIAAMPLNNSCKDGPSGKWLSHFGFRLDRPSTSGTIIRKTYHLWKWEHPTRSLRKQRRFLLANSNKNALQCPTTHPITRWSASSSRDNPAESETGRNPSIHPTETAQSKTRACAGAVPIRKGPHSLDDCWPEAGNDLWWEHGQSCRGPVAGSSITVTTNTSVYSLIRSVECNKEVVGKRWSGDASPFSAMANFAGSMEPWIPISTLTFYATMFSAHLNGTNLMQQHLFFSRTMLEYILQHQYRSEFRSRYSLFWSGHQTLQTSTSLSTSGAI